MTAGLAIAGPASAELRQYGNVIYPLPPGWSGPGDGDDGYATLWSELPDERCEYCRIMMGRGAPARGSITDWLDGRRFDFIDEDERADFEVVQPAAVTSAGGRDAALTMLNDGSDMLMLVAIRAGNRFELAGFKGDSGDLEALEESRAVMSDTFLPWLGLLRFRSEGAPSLLPEPRAGDLGGLWWGHRMDSVLGMDMMLQMRNSYRRVVFWPDGTFIDGTSPTGMAAPDRATLDAALRTDWGNYAHSGDRLTLSYADGRQEVLAREGEAWSDGSYDLVQVALLGDGARLDGGISSISYTGFTPGSGISGGVSSSSETRFFPDGRYQGESFGGAFGSFDGGGGFSVGDEGGDSGRYEVRDGLLIFRPTNGQPRAEMIFDAGGTVMIGDSFFEGTVLGAR